MLIVDAIALARDLHLLNVDSTTFTRADLARGFEPEACLYIQHARHCAMQSHTDLTVDPPSDLVMEIDITSPSLNKLPIYAAVGIAAVWRYTRAGLPLYQLLQDGYVPQGQAAFCRTCGAA